jgi:hypothetical protein
MERTIEIVECTVIYDAWEEGADERERLSECVETVDVPFDEVVEYLREKCSVRAFRRLLARGFTGAESGNRV